MEGPGFDPALALLSLQKEKEKEKVQSIMGLNSKWLTSGVMEPQSCAMRVS